MSEKKASLATLTNGILKENPTLVLILGTCPTLATTQTVIGALGMGIAALLVLLCSNVFISLLRRVRAEMPSKNIWCYSGYTLEELMGKIPSRARCEHTDEMLSLIDVLVDGEFKEELKDIRLRFRGSSNQRVIDLRKTLEAGETVLLELK